MSRAQHHFLMTTGKLELKDRNTHLHIFQIFFDQTRIWGVYYYYYYYYYSRHIFWFIYLKYESSHLRTNMSQTHKETHLYIAVQLLLHVEFLVWFSTVLSPLRRHLTVTFMWGQSTKGTGHRREERLGEKHLATEAWIRVFIFYSVPYRQPQPSSFFPARSDSNHGGHCQIRFQSYCWWWA